MASNEPTAQDTIDRCDEIQKRLDSELNFPCSVLSRNLLANPAVAIDQHFQEQVVGFRERYRELSYEYFHRLLGRTIFAVFVDSERRFADRCTFPEGGPTYQTLVKKLKDTTLSFVHADDQVGDLELAVKNAKQSQNRGI